MSAFVCGRAHILGLAAFAALESAGRSSCNVEPRYVRGLESLDGKRGVQLAAAYADVLYQQNVRSVNHRYRESEEPEPLAPSGVELAASVIGISAVQILKMCNCLEYQSCENDDYYDTVAYRLTVAIKDAAIRQLPGYEGAEWGHPLEFVK